MFAIQSDRTRRLLEVTFERAFWNHAVVDRFVAECVEAAVALDCELGTQRTIVHLRNAMLQSQAVIARLGKFMGDPTVGRVALVATTPLERMQSRRLIVRDDIRLFDDMAAATAWLDVAPLDAA